MNQSNARPTSLDDALIALDRCDVVVSRLHKMCCEPDRSPEMASIERALGAVRACLTSTTDAVAMDEVLAQIEAIGSRLGRLQVGCCTSARLPLYADALANLNEIQLTVSRARGTGH